MTIVLVATDGSELSVHAARRAFELLGPSTEVTVLAVLSGAPGADAGGFEVSDVVLLAVISVIAVVSKLIGSGLGARLAGEDIRSSVQIGTAMISRGEFGLIVASVGLTQGLIDQNLFSVMVLMVLVTTLVTPILLKIVFAKEKEAEYA